MSLGIQYRGREKEPPRVQEEAPYGMRMSGGIRSESIMDEFPDRARDTQTDEIVALKKVRMDKEKDGEWEAGTGGER